MTDKEKIIAEIERLKKEIPYHENAWSVLDKLKRFINSLPAEQVSEDLEEEIKSYLITNRQYAGGDEEDLWGDDCIQDAIKHGANWQKQQIINKSCEWLQKHMNDYLVHGRDIDFLYDDFRKAMGKEDEPNIVNIEPPSFEESQGEFNSYNVALNG